MENAPANLFDLHIDQESTSYLGETAKWAKFLAILGFIGCGLEVLFGVFAGSIMSGAMAKFGADGAGAAGAGAFFTISAILGALIGFFPSFYLFNFAAKTQLALRNNDQPQLTQAFRNLKSHYKFIGILVIVALSFAALILVFDIIALMGK